MQLTVNGIIMQDGNSSEMLWTIHEQLAEISRYLTIEPGDILFTDPPAGSAASRGVPILNRATRSERKSRASAPSRSSSAPPARA